jgi:hypothetical protein
MVVAKITKVVGSVAERKIHIAYGLVALRVGEAQMVREVRA